MRLIDANKLLEDYTQTFVVEHGIASAEMFQGVVNQSPTVEAIPVTEKAFEMFEADYEARLKADLEAILVELQLEIEESENCGKAFHLGLQMASNIIQQRINALKGKQKEKNEVEGRN